MNKLLAFLRRIKLVYIVYNFFNRKKLKHLEKEYKKRGLKKSYYSIIKRSDFKNIEELPPLLDRADSATILPKNKHFLDLPEQAKQGIINWSRDGYAILPNFFSENEVNTINEEVDKLIAAKKAKWRYGNKIMFGIKQSKELMDIANHKTLKAVLNLLLDKKTFVFQSINFINGSEQATHSDSIHMTTFPLGYLVAVWIALEDITVESGPLHYYPGSHKLPYLLHDDYKHGGNAIFLGKEDYKKYEAAIATELEKNKQFNKKLFLAKKGDILIWHANLLHGGTPINDITKTRKSMVLHYYAEDVICYHEVTERPALIN